MVEDFVARTLSTRDCAHLNHWHTSSYAEHVALGDFYEDLLDKLDEYVECYQGKYGLLKKVHQVCYEGPILKCLEDDLDWLNRNEEALSKDCSALKNILDEIAGIYLKAGYKLKFLS